LRKLGRNIVQASTLGEPQNPPALEEELYSSYIPEIPTLWLGVEDDEFIGGRYDLMIFGEHLEDPRPSWIAYMSWFMTYELVLSPRRFMHTIRIIQEVVHHRGVVASWSSNGI
jgi:hypothetical protein